ncbi:MAG: glycosyltransferase [Lachnospiraceae bacterium]|nr:glycosyltransferase [uncultured Acetatifactor sp.]MCI8749612.1 glycosyltransferase [Lachnospiraceae bacterium]
MQKIYICHQYYAPNHFQALYECANIYGFEAENLIVLNPMSAVKHRQMLIEQKGLKTADEWYTNNSVAQGRLWLLRDEIVVVGLAPYDRLFAQYQEVLKRNHSIYMTSWADWHTDYVPYPYPDNKAGFMETLEKCIDGVACISHKTEREISNWKEFTQVVNHAVKVDDYVKKNNFVRSGKYIFLGQLIERKNFRIVLDYMKRHPKKDISIDFVGDGVLRDAIEEYASKDKRVHLLGYLSSDEIKVRLHEYDYLILPSREELFGIVLLEAMACGVPCIVSDAVGPSEIIAHDKTGIMFSLTDVKSFDFAMEYSIALDDDKYKCMCNAVLKESIRYDVSEVIKKWISLIKQVCSDSSMSVKNKML